jgi:hypothetical protein
MVSSPLLEQHVDIRLYEPNRSDDVGGPHLLDRANAERLVAVRKVDHNDGSGLSNVDMRRPMLARRKKNAHLKPVDVQDGWHWLYDNLTIGLLTCPVDAAHCNPTGVIPDRIIERRETSSV